MSLSRYCPCRCLQQMSVHSGQIAAVYSSMSGDASLRRCLSFHAISEGVFVILCREKIICREKRHNEQEVNVYLPEEDRGGGYQRMFSRQGPFVPDEPGGKGDD